MSTEANWLTRSVGLGAQWSTLPFTGLKRALCCKRRGIFNDPHIDPRRCQQVCYVSGEDLLLKCKADLEAYHPFLAAQVITKLLYLLCQGETFTKVGSA